MIPSTSTRRQLLLGGGLAAAGLGLAAAGASRAAAARTATGAGARAGALTAARGATYAALVEAVGVAPGNQVDPARAGYALERFGRWYARIGEHGRASTDDLLDRLDAATGDAGPFTALEPPARLAVLRADPLLAGALVPLAAAAFAPHATDDRPPEVTL